MTSRFQNNCRFNSEKCGKEKGFSLIELLIVLAMITILTAISLPYWYNHNKLYKSEEQSLKLLDLMREAGQLALNRRRTFRLEIDLTDNAVLLIDENGAGTADDTLVKSNPLTSAADVRIDTNPSGILQPMPPNYANAVFAIDALGHRVGAATVIGNNVWQLRFASDGSVLNAAGNAPVSATLFVWPPLTPGNAAARNNAEVRAVTIYGGSGAVRYWKYNGAAFQPY